MPTPSFKKFSTIFAAVVGAVLTLIVLGLLLALAVAGPGVPLIAFFVLMYGWIIYVFVRYRQARQSELLHVILASIDADLPLAPALRAYLRDRPNSALYHFWLGMLLHIIVAPYYWVWHRQHDFDRRIAKLADELESGATLSQAFQAVPSVASHEARVAAAVGEVTGNLAECLRRSDRELTTAAWMELMPRFLYPIFLMLFIFVVTSFFMVAVAPRFKKIFEDFKLPLPAQTMLVVHSWNAVVANAGWIAIAAVACIAVVVGLVASPSFRWHFPVIGRLYGWDLQSLVLRSLGLLVEMGQPVPKALELLHDVGDLPAVVKRQLAKARQAVSNGEPLAAALRGAGLMPRSMAALVQTAERTRTLGWALRELGELLAGKAIRVARRLSMLFAPLMVIAVGCVVAMVVIGIFLPLINMIEALS
jgi:type IV pilus assembly protein PilC